ncbi:M23 family metallopeptidase [Bacillus suaedaesalsae]|uniref:M23 family metallopeptidase n=1 Tax=Bacillus suaedaesalsae TaxID=2810349 RepID=A0ABS2DJF1_9BACI|nr:M23 family metallopeptidase [Bacillus suaedaesalsae]MBM6618619.1 M23 family metallopeptidase [Bacillus suaedaesalsae]
MKTWFLIISSITIILVSCSNEKYTHHQNKVTQGMKLSTNQTDKNRYVNTNVGYVNLYDTKYVAVQEISEKLRVTYEYDEINRILKFNNGQETYTFIYGVPVFNNGSEHFPTSRTTFEIIKGEPYLSIDFFKGTLQAKVLERKELLTINIPKEKTDVPASTKPLVPKDIEEILSLLSILDNPIKGANVSTVPSHLPGAKRAYRHGTHEGMDFYQYSSKVTINQQTPVYGMAEGKVVRADHDYAPYPNEKVRNNDLQIAATLPTTPEYMLDKLRGKQVWISYPNGVLARYAHLDSIPASVRVGEVITKDTVVGYVGNSGTSGEVKKDNSELHLHLDLLIHNELFWKGLSTEDVKQILKHLFEQK